MYRIEGVLWFLKSFFSKDLERVYPNKDFRQYIYKELLQIAFSMQNFQ